MNNIKSFDEYNGYELERVAYDNVLNEKSIMGGGIRGLINRVSSGKVKAQLAEEIELSKSIMEGIQEGLEKLNENFDAIRKDVAEGGDDPKGEKQKKLDEILKIIEDSRKKTWDINELIDEGEIDYAGFTANVGLASAAYFGILFTPFRATILMHKGYSYFFGIVKNTIRKALVMLQLNFDQFENLIVAKGFQSADYIQDVAANQKIDDTISAILKELCGEKTGMIKSKSKAADYRKNIETAYKAVKLEQEKRKTVKQSRDIYNNLDPYNNTYTKSLEALRQYSSDDVQKYLDAIKNSMNKFAGQEADLQTFSELILAAAEEHAYKVSSSIYSKFAKMTEVFSLPNQKKLIDLIEAATKEEMERSEAEKKKKEEDDRLKIEEEVRTKIEESGIKVFTKLKGVKIGKLVDEKYKKDEIEHPEAWTGEEYFNLEKEEKENLEEWLVLHPEVLELCDKSLQVIINTPFTSSAKIDTRYIDALIDYIAPCVDGVEEVSDAYILNFDEFILEAKDEEDPDVDPKDDEEKYVLSDEEKEELDEKIDELNDNLGELLKLIYGEDAFKGLESLGDLKKVKVTPKASARLKYVLEKYDMAAAEESKSGPTSGTRTKASTYLALKRAGKSITSKKKITNYYLKISKKKIDDSELKNLKDLFKNENEAIAGLKAIGEKLLKSKTFVNNSENIVSIINKAIKARGKGIPISFMTSFLITNSAETLDDLRNKDYVSGEEESKKSEK